MQHSIIHTLVSHTHVDSSKSYNLHIVINNNIHIYESRNKNTLATKIKNDARQRIKDRINEKLKIQIKHLQNKNKTRNEKDISNLHTIDEQKYKNLRHHVFNNNTKVNTNPQYFTNTKIEELDDFKNSSD